ncbi:MAG: hypothetical protein REI64_08805 [Pedobacter sp.]|uniref:hypothetical protein n=1 Tax=Pedobacter sp. TaxID=1411316 RepID=UPI0028083A2B|nr:hypothetical protein [Pedobacter sp.]MDQ8004884.1 hypothetical protein [Pedobacter sp.]
MPLKIHAIILALNEEDFIIPQLDTLYNFCSRISIITQYDRDWYASFVKPDNTANLILNYPDPHGKIHFTVRRLPDEAAARNMEMLSFNGKPYKGTISHGRAFNEIIDFHEAPDYFWIVDADEIYDIQTIPSILKYLEQKKPRGMRVTGYNYVENWHQRIPNSIIDFTHFGFIKPNLLFEQRRTISWNLQRLSKLFKILRLPDLSDNIYGFINCPKEVGVFHHACWIGDKERIWNKFQKSSHSESKTWDTESVKDFKFENIPFNELPTNIQNANWPINFIHKREKN